jgi:hypothetical protein
MNQEQAWFHFVSAGDTIHVEADSLFHELPHFDVSELVDLLTDF